MLRKFSKDRDVELLIEGETEAYVSSFPGSPVPLDQVTSRVRSIERGRSHCVVLDEGGPKGYLVYSRHVGAEGAEVYVESIYLKPEARGKEKVALLLRSVTVPSVNTRVSLDVSITNKRAMKAYLNLGFVSERVRMTKSYAPGTDTD